MPGACCSFLNVFLHSFVCTFQFFLTDGASSMQMICCIFKVFCVSSSIVSWAGFFSLLNDIYFRFVFCLCGDSNNPVPQKIVFMLLCSRYVWRCRCDGVWGCVELTSQSAITVTFWIEAKSHATYMHCLHSCPQINVTHSGMNRVTAIVCYTVQHVGWCDWLVTQNSNYWYHKICNISCLN